MTRITLVLLASALACAPAASARRVVPPSLSSGEARSALGHLARLTGTVVQVKDHAHRGFAYLNFDARFPDQTFSVLIPDSAVARFGDLTRFEGHLVRATGILWLQDGKTPAMTVTDPVALELLP